MISIFVNLLKIGSFRYILMKEFVHILEVISTLNLKLLCLGHQCLLILELSPWIELEVLLNFLLLVQLLFLNKMLLKLIVREDRKEDVKFGANYLEVKTLEKMLR